MDQEDRLKEKERVLLLLRKYAVNSISYLDLEEDKSWNTVRISIIFT